LPFDPVLSPAFSFALETYAFYRSIMPSGAASPNSEAEPGLGGRLLYVGELDQQGRSQVVAGNIAGAASLSTSADPTMQKQAIRDGVADFLVNSLDEALRILKNEIRKRNPVAVCVAAAPAAVEQEMLERGVQPDLHRVSLTAGEPEQTQFVSWSVESSPARWLPRLDAIAMGCLAPEAVSARRWLRLAPRYLGRAAQAVRILPADGEFAARFAEQVRQCARSGEIGVEVQIKIGHSGEEYHILPQVQQPSTRL
jgi:urocanate hydratase